jgi:AP-1 complex subunit beta-1
MSYIVIHVLGLLRQAVRAIGRCAVSLERAAERCINVLLELIQTKVNYVVQEAIIVIKDIFRRYPNRCCNKRPNLTIY